MPFLTKPFNSFKAFKVNSLVLCVPHTITAVNLFWGLLRCKLRANLGKNISPKISNFHACWCSQRLLLLWLALLVWGLQSIQGITWSVSYDLRMVVLLTVSSLVSLPVSRLLPPKSVLFTGQNSMLSVILNHGIDAFSGTDGIRTHQKLSNKKLRLATPVLLEHDLKMQIFNVFLISW